MSEPKSTYFLPDFERILKLAEETDRHYILRFRRANGNYAYVTTPYGSVEMITEAWLYNLDEVRATLAKIKALDVRNLEQQLRRETIEVISVV